MPMPFAQEFAKNLAETLKSSYVINRIDEAKQQGFGHLSRLFDQMPISQATQVESYNLASKSRIEDHMREVAKEGASILFNSDLTDLSDDVKKHLGENYDQLVAVCGNDKIEMVDILLKAVVVSYAQVVTNGLEPIIEPLPYDQKQEKKAEYNEHIMAPMERYIANISKAKLVNGVTIDINHQDLLNKAKELQSQLMASKSNLKKLIEDPATVQENKELMERLNKTLDTQIDKLEAQIDKLEMLQDVAVRPALTAIVEVCERITNDIKPIQNVPYVKGIGEQILNAILYFFGGWKSEATKASEQREELAPSINSNIDSSIQATKSIKNQLHEVVHENAPKNTQHENDSEELRSVIPK